MAAFYRYIFLWCAVTATLAQSSNNPVIVYPDSIPFISGVQQFSASYRIILNGTQTNNLFTLVQDLIYNGNSSRHQIHTREDETITVLNGTLQVYLGGYQFCAPTGTTFYIPRNTEQSQRTLGSKPVLVQISFTPSGIESYLYQIIPFLAQPMVNKTAANILAQASGLTFLTDVAWQDLHCVFDSDNGIPTTTSSSIGGSTATSTGGSTATSTGGSTAISTGGSTATSTGGSTTTSAAFSRKMLFFEGFPVLFAFSLFFSFF